MQRNAVQKFMQSFVAMGCQVVFQNTFVTKIWISFRSYLDICYLVGDAYHITQPHNDGRGAILAMTSALKQVSYWPLKYFQMLSFLCT